jgi:glycosyltransferase involved in cell wall biosynthesis
VILAGQDGGLDRLQEAVRVVRGEEGEAASVQGPKRRARVGQGLPHDRGDDRREHAHPEPTETRGAVAPDAGEARADDDIRLPRDQWLENRAQLTWIVLSVTVDLHGDVVPVAERVAVAGLNRSADAEVERQSDESGTHGLGDLRGAVVGTVVDNEDVERWIDRSDLSNDAANGLGLVESRDDRDSPLSGEPALEWGLNCVIHRAGILGRPLRLLRIRLSGRIPRPVRICLVYDCLFPYTVGGGERWYRALAERLAREGHEVTYLTLRQWARGKEPDIAGVHVVEVGPQLELYVDGRRRIGPALRFGRGVLRHLLGNGGRYDIVHCGSTPFFALLAAGLARRRGRYRLLVDWIEVWTLDYWREYLGSLKGTIGWVVQRLATRVGERAFCYSHLHARRLRAEGFRGAVDVIGVYGGPLDRPEPAPAEPLVVFVGRHIPEKGVLALPPAIAAAREDLPNLRAEILGDGPLRQDVQRLVHDEGLDDVISVPGFVSEDHRRESVRRALCLAAPSTREGYGLVIVEAAALATPSLVVNGPDNAALELVADGVNGIVAGSTDPGELSRAILRVHEGSDALRASTADWFARNAHRLSLESSLQTVLNAYARG